MCVRFGACISSAALGAFLGSRFTSWRSLWGPCPGGGEGQDFRGGPVFAKGSSGCSPLRCWANGTAIPAGAGSRCPQHTVWVMCRVPEGPPCWEVASPGCCLLPGEEQGTPSPCGVCPLGVLGWPRSPPGARSPAGWCRRGLGAGVCHSPPQNPMG